jgi:hypothetical protein
MKGDLSKTLKILLIEKILSIFGLVNLRKIIKALKK